MDEIIKNGSSGQNGQTCQNGPKWPKQQKMLKNRSELPQTTETIGKVLNLKQPEGAIDVNPLRLLGGKNEFFVERSINQHVQQQ